MSWENQTEKENNEAGAIKEMANAYVQSLPEDIWQSSSISDIERAFIAGYASREQWQGEYAENLKELLRRYCDCPESVIENPEIILNFKITPIEKGTEEWKRADKLYKEHLASHPSPQAEQEDINLMWGNIIATVVHDRKNFDGKYQGTMDKLKAKYSLIKK